MQESLSLFDYDGEIICGVDEAGRGPLAGPVMAAAVILDPKRPIIGLRDSKNYQKQNAKHWQLKSSTMRLLGLSHSVQSKRLTDNASTARRIASIVAWRIFNSS